jgi:hypothetical protein
MKSPAYLDDEDGEGGFGANRTKATLSRELADFLVELSIAMQKHAIYPAGHPLLDTAVDKVMKNIALLLVERDSLSIGIARKQLIIEGVGTDPNHPLLKELSTKLHKHNLGAIKFSSGLTAEELRDALATIAVEPDRGDEPLGVHAEELSEKWQYVRLFPLNYDRLQLLYAGNSTEGEERVLKRGTPKSAQLWVGMARAAMMLDEDAELDEDSTNPLVVAETIDKRQSEKAYDQVIVGYLLQIAEELKEQGGTPEAAELQKKISELVRQLSPESIRRLLQMGGDVGQRRNFLLNASQGMTVEAVMDLVNAATAQGTQSISHSMMRLFSKLSKYAETDSDPMRRANAESSMREQMSKLISEWKLDDPNPTAYGKVLQKMSRARAIESNNPYIDCEPERILQMGFELSTTGPRFEIAVEAMLNAARLEPLLAMLDKCADPEFADAVWQLLDSRDILWAALTEARIDFSVLERIVRRKRLSAIEPILDVAERSKDARQRDKLLELLAELGDDIGPYVAQRLEVTRSDFKRDLFLMLGRLKTLPEGFDASRFLLHTDASVRREAVRLLLKFAETREQAIVAALTDSDERASFYGLQAAQEGGCPPKALPLVRKRLEEGTFDSSLMTLAIRVIAAADSGAGPVVSGKGRTSTIMRAVTADTTPAATAAASKKTMEWLISRVAKQSRFLKKWELLPKSPEMLAALGALAAYWTMDPTVQEIVNLGIKSNDPELRKAMGSQRVTGRFKAITE